MRFYYASKVVKCWKLEKATLLSKYKAAFRNWRRKQSDSKVVYEEKLFQPFINFGLSPQKSPDWYDAYNQVKHNREENLEKASLENCMNAVAGILILLYLQFGSQWIATSKTGDFLIQKEDEDADDSLFQPDALFVVYTPLKSDWKASQLYDFQWNNLKKEQQFTAFERRIVKLSATPLRNRPHMVFCSQGTS